MNKSPLTLALALALAAGAAAFSPAAVQAQAAQAAAAPGKPVLGSFGVDLTARDESVKPGDDFARHANGTWLDTYQLRDYDSRYGAFNLLNDQAEAQIKTIVEELQADGSIQPGSDAQKVRDYYASYMDQAARDAAGIAPLQPLLSRIDAIDDVAALTEAFGNAAVDGTAAPVSIGLSIDRKNPDRYLATANVGGLGLPDKDFYANPDARFVKIRAAYVDNIAKLLGYAGVTGADATARAEAVLALETNLARHHWDRAARRDRDKTYNLVSFADFARTYPGYDWTAHLKAQGMPAPAEINIATPTAVAPVLAAIADTPIAAWRDYLRYHAVRNNAAYLSKEIDLAAFSFNGPVLAGTKTQRDPWQRAVAEVGGMGGLGDAVGKIYVERHFSPASKAAMDELVENLRKALRQNIDKLDWMGAETKAEAYKKLETFKPKIGYTSEWRDYSSVAISPKDLMANVRALRAYNNADTNRRVGTRPDRDEWFMTPQTVNAYYNAQFNEIVFPAAILQPPFFDVSADPAVNYGAIGGVIGHEMGHGFDDQGSKSDFAGIQRMWWTEADRANFDAKTKVLGAQYATYCPLEGQCINPGLTMGENIGDLGGLSMAYTAYRLSLDGKEAPVIDGLTGDQRFFLAWAQVWKSKQRDEETINRLKSDSHSPPYYRINGAVRNLDEWYAAFDVKPGDKMYLPPEQRVRIW
jgi:putative endopeptidase